MGVDTAEARTFWNVQEQIYTKFSDLRELTTLQSIWNFVDYDKFIEHPADYIQELFAEKESMFPPIPTNVWETRILQVLRMKHFERRCQSVDMPKIPCLNDLGTDTIKLGQVVRFRCIVQDCLGPEMCQSEVTMKDPTTGEIVNRSTLLQDVAVVVNEELPKGMGGRDSISERELLIGISPPGESSWITGMSSEQPTAGFSAEEKRMRMDTEDPDCISLPNYLDVFPELFKNVGDAKPVAALLKVYESNLKPNDLVEVTGVIDLDDGENVAERNVDAMDEMSSNYYPKSDKLPKLYVFSCLKLADGNPQMPMIEEKIFPLINTSDINVAQCAQALRDILASALGGDRYAAVYAMIALVSGVIHREDAGYGPIGKIVLNVGGIPETSEIPQLFQYILKHLVPRTLPLDFTIDNVNSWKLTPKKNMHNNQLETGMFQMASGTHVLINETRLHEGAFESAGAHNIAVVRELLHSQQVKYDYTYQFPQLPTDAPAIVLSNTPSVLPVDVRINLKPDAKFSLEERRARIEQILSEKVTSLRAYLSFARTILKSSHPVFAEDSLNEDFEAFFRTRNQPGVFNTKMTPSQFSTFITSCRLWALLNGELSITRNVFMFFKDLEIIRDGRLLQKKSESEPMQ